jgi:ABC-2 type transport system permease protein
MSKLWLVAKYEYVRHVFKKSFILATLSMPLILALSVGLGWLIESMENNDAPVGYVDHAGFLADAITAPQRVASPNNPSVSDLVPLIPFQTEEEAQEALGLKAIQAYYVVAADYRQTNQVELVYIEPPGDNVPRQFWDFMQINKITDVPPDLARRAVAGTNLIVRWPDDRPGGGREFSAGTFLNNLLPFFIGLGFVMLLFMSAGYLTQAVATEKESRTMEIVISSISPGQLIGGKVLGIIAMTLTQIVAWIAFAALSLLIGSRYLDISVLQNLSVDPQIIITMLAIAAPTYVMVAALMAAVGATVAEGQDAQQMAGLFSLPIIAPVWLGAVIIESPNSPLVIALSLFPPTALTTTAMRIMSVPIPLWQIAVSVTLLTLSAGGALWLAARIFRLGMLRYGKRLSWRELFQGETPNAERQTSRKWRKS